MSGAYGTNLIFSSLVSTRADAGLINGAKIKREGQRYVVEFCGRGAEWNGNSLKLCNALNADHPLTFQSFKAAKERVIAIGLGRFL